jgi:hypothetical protein
MKSFTSAPLVVQCSVPVRRNCSFMDQNLCAFIRA